MASETDKSSPTLWDWALRVGGLALVGLAIWKVLGLQPGLAQVLVLAGLGLVLLFAGLIGRLRSFTVSIADILSLGAEARETVQEAQDVTRELRILAKSLGSEVLNLVVKGNRYSGAEDVRSMFDRAEATVELMRSVGLTEADIAEALARVRPWHIVDYCQIITTLAEAKRDPSTNDIWNAFWQPWRETIDRPPPDVLERWLREHGWVDDEINEWLQDYRHFVDRGEHRRPAIFRDRSTVIKEAEARKRAALKARA